MKIAIILGGTNPHKALIKKLKIRGFKTILVDYLDNPPAKEDADIHIKESTLDNEAVLKVAQMYNVDLIMSACVDQANVTACYVAEKLHLPHPYSYELANNITNKGYMKKIMLDNNIPTTRYIYLDKGESLQNFSLSFPVMVKPADACAASGVKKANNMQELRTYLTDAQRISRNNRAIVEEFFEGNEVSVYAFVIEKEAKILMISQRMSVIEGENKVLKCYATLTPAPISNNAYLKICKISNQIAKSFNLDNTPLHVQFLINQDDVDVIEFAPRVGGGISYETIQWKTGFDILEATIDSYLENKVQYNASNSNSYYSVNIVYGTKGIFKEITGVEELMNEGIIESWHYHKTPGMRVTTDRASGGRIGAFITKGNDKLDLLNKIKAAIDRLDVFDINGSSIMRKDLYISTF